MYKRLLVVVLVLIFAFSLWGKTKTVCQSLEVEDSVPVFQKDTLPVKGSLDFLRIKRTGRYDRGIMNYRFIPKGKWTSGFIMSYRDYNSADNKLLFAYFDNSDCDGRNLNFSMHDGYAMRDNTTLGSKFGYRNIRGALNNITLKIDDDIDFSLRDLKLEQNLYSVSFFHRSYVGLDAGKRFGLLNGTALTFNFEKSKFDRGVEENLVSIQTDIFEVQSGINPGLTAFIMQNVSIECSPEIAGIRYRQEKQKNNLGETEKRMTGRSNFRVSPFNISLGLTVRLWFYET